MGGLGAWNHPFNTQISYKLIDLFFDPFFDNPKSTEIWGSYEEGNPLFEGEYPYSPNNVHPNLDANKSS